MQINAESTVPLVKETMQLILDNPEKMFELIQVDMKKIAENTVSRILESEMRDFLGRDRYQRKPGSGNHRNGSYLRQYTAKNLGTLEIKVPRDRSGEFESKTLAKYKRYDSAIEKDMCLMFLSGMSTRSIELMSKTLLGRRISASEVSLVNKEMLDGIDQWRLRSLDNERIKYMYMDGVNFKMRSGSEIVTVPMLVVIGVKEDNRKVFLCIQQGDKECSTTWRQVFKDLKQRGLSKDLIQLGIMDGLPGLMNVFRSEFPKAKVQRCQVHVARNVLCKVTKNKKLEVSDRLRNVFYASTKAKAMEAYREFVTQYREEFSSATACLTNVIDECLTFMSFPEEQWHSLRTTNTIERVNKEFKRRTKPMEILAGEKSSYRLLCFVALKMEQGWKSMPIHQKSNLPSLREFTQLN